MRVRNVQRSATLAWSTGGPGSFLAVGTAAGTMSENFDSTGSLEIFSVDFNEGPWRPYAGIKTENKIHRLAWSGDFTLRQRNLEFGILAGGMDNGNITLWNPAALLHRSNESPLVHNIEKHLGAVRGLDFNPGQASLLASGSANGEVLVWDLNVLQPYAPGTQKSPSGDSAVSSIQWNRKVKHILASSASNGIAVIWDLKAKRAVMSLKDQQSSQMSSVAWHPNNQTQLITASEDDRSPTLSLWDLKNTYAPLKTFQGHSAGILSIDWSRSDPSLILSGSRDERVLCWDVNTGEIVSELERTEGWKFDVQWSPKQPTLISTASLSGNVDIFSMNDFRSPDTNGELDGGMFAPQQTKTHPKFNPNRAPGWLKRPASVAFGFGGKLVSIPMQQPGSGPSPITLYSMTTDSDLVARAVEFQQAVKEHKLEEFCDRKSQTVQGDDKYVWNILKVLHSEDSRTSLLTTLGFSRETVDKELTAFVEAMPNIAPLEEEKVESPKPKPKTQAPSSPPQAVAPPPPDGLDTMFDDDSSDFDFGSLAQQQPLTPHKSESHDADDEVLESNESEPVVDMSPITFACNDQAEVMITKALLIGNFQHAVETCIRQSRFADALIIASVAGGPLLAQTQQRYIKFAKSSFLTVSHLLATKNYRDIVKRSELSHWRKVLAIISAYSSPDEFQPLCDLLGDRLAPSEAMQSAALICYLCAGNLSKVSKIWIDQLGKSNGSDSSFQALIEKSTVFSMAVSNNEASPFLADVYARYGEQLAAQGELEVALQYLGNQNDPSSIKTSAGALYHRIRNSIGTNDQSLLSPFDTVTVGATVPQSAPSNGRPQAQHGAAPAGLSTPQAKPRFPQSGAPVDHQASNLNRTPLPFQPPNPTGFNPYSNAGVQANAPRPNPMPTNVGYPNPAPPSNAQTPVRPQLNSVKPPAPSPVSTPFKPSVPTTFGTPTPTPAIGPGPVAHSVPSPGPARIAPPQPVFSPPMPGLQNFSAPTPSPLAPMQQPIVQPGPVVAPPPVRMPVPVSTPPRGAFVPPPVTFATPPPVSVGQQHPLSPSVKPHAPAPAPAPSPVVKPPMPGPAPVPAPTAQPFNPGPPMPAVKPQSTPTPVVAPPPRGSVHFPPAPINQPAAQPNPYGGAPTPTLTTGTPASPPPSRGSRAYPATPTFGGSQSGSQPTPTTPGSSAAPPPMGVAPPPKASTPSAPPPPRGSAPAGNVSPPKSTSTQDGKPVGGVLRSYMANLKSRVTDAQYARHIQDLESRVTEIAAVCESSAMDGNAIVALNELMTELGKKNYSEANNIMTRINNDYYYAVGSKGVIGLKRLIQTAQQFQL